MRKLYFTLSFIFCVNIIAFSQKLLLKPQTSISESKTYLGNGKFSDSISVCTTYLYDTEIIRKYNIYVTVDLNNYLPSSENVADWNYTDITEKEEALLKKQGVMFCDITVIDKRIAGWYKVSYYTEKEKRTQSKQNINSGISENKNVGKYKPIRGKEDLLKALENLKSKKK